MDMKKTSPPECPGHALRFPARRWSSWWGWATSGLLCTLLCVACQPLRAQSPTVISEFNRVGFNSLCCGFTQQVGASSVSLRSADGWGLADVRTTGINFTQLADQSFQIRLKSNPGNVVEQLTLALVDSRGTEAKWNFQLRDQLSEETWTVAKARQPLSNPESGTGDWQNFNLQDVRFVRVLGDFDRPGKFDMAIDRIAIQPAETYAGREANAPWRAVAEERIRALRTAPLTITVTDATGKLVPAAQVAVKMERHAFPFGAAVQHDRLNSSTPDNRIYQQKVEELFNWVTIENSLKWPPWDGHWGSVYSQAQSLRALEWLRNREISVRGHALVWPGVANLPPPVVALLNQSPLSAAQKSTLNQMVLDHITDEVGKLKDLVVDWDVVNEPRTNHDLMDALGSGNAAMVPWFQQTRLIDPDAKLFLNEYDILESSENVDTPNQRLLMETVKNLQAAGAPIDGIGLQSHFTGVNLTGPEQLWQILDNLGELDVSLAVTEFDIDTKNEQLQADYTRDFLTAMFAHPAVDSFVMWGFWQKAHWRPDAAMFRNDWSIKPNGEAFQDLVFRQWWTDENVQTDEQGQAQVTGFKGDYGLTVTLGGQKHTIPARLVDPAQLQIKLPFDVAVLGDLNDDGAMDRADLTLLEQTSLNQQFSAALDLDLSGAVNRADVDQWLESLYQTTLGDLDLDRDVDSADLLELISGWTGALGSGEGRVSYLQGDLDGDGDTDSNDLLVEIGAWTGARAQLAVVPESAPGWTWLMLVVGLWRQRHGLVMSAEASC